MSKFVKGNNVLAKCRGCGKLTHSSIDSLDIRLCRACNDAALLENEHSDGHHDKKLHADCPDCAKEGRDSND